MRQCVDTPKPTGVLPVRESAEAENQRIHVLAPSGVLSSTASGIRSLSFYLFRDNTKGSTLSSRYKYVRSFNAAIRFTPPASYSGSNLGSETGYHNYGSAWFHSWTYRRIILSHNCFRPHDFQFVIHYHPVISDYNIGRITDSLGKQNINK